MICPRCRKPGFGPDHCGDVICPNCGFPAEATGADVIAAALVIVVALLALILKALT